MSIIRTKAPVKYTIINNELLAESSKLSWQAIGLLVYLLSKPDDWSVSIAALANIGKCGKNRIESILKELKLFGYIVCKKHRTGKYTYYVYDTPQVTPEPPEPKKQDPEPEKQASNPRRMPEPENPVQGFPEQGFRELLNTDINQLLKKATTTEALPEIEKKPKTEKAAAVAAFSFEDLTEPEKTCLIWAKKEKFWSSRVFSISAFKALYDKPDSPLRGQFENWEILNAKENEELKPKPRRLEVWERAGFKSEKEYATHSFNEQMAKLNHKNLN